MYNCLKHFTEKKLLQEIVVQRELVFYDTVTTPHAHVYDMDSGELRDLDIHRDLHTATGYQGTVNMQMGGKNMTMFQKYSGRWIGDCSVSR